MNNRKPIQVSGMVAMMSFQVFLLSQSLDKGPQNWGWYGAALVFAITFLGSFFYLMDLIADKPEKPADATVTAEEGADDGTE